MTRIPQASWGLSHTPVFSAIKLSALASLLACLAVTVGCETAAPRQQGEMKQVSIADPSQVAGKWEGLLRRVPPSRTDTVTLIVLSDGRFRFTSARTIGLLTGEGTFTVTDGRLTAGTERGSMEATLFEGEERRMLRATGQSSDGIGFIAELMPVKSHSH